MGWSKREFESKRCTLWRDPVYRSLESCCLEGVCHRPTVEDHVHRAPRLGNHRSLVVRLVSVGNSPLRVAPKFAPMLYFPILMALEFRQCV